MARVLKIIGGLLLALVILIIAFGLYTSRKQTIDFANFIPPKTEFCSEEITTEHIEYKKLATWLSTNQEGWKETPASYLPNYIYSSPDFQVIITESFMVVNYRSGEAFSQVIKRTNTNGLVSECD